MTSLPLPQENASLSHIITLTTDFGLNDHFVGAMKGVIHGINADAQIVDICNSVQSFDILEGALTIVQAYRYFPVDTINMVIVDPGVGSARRPILVTTEKHRFVAPDNGVLSLVYDREERISVRHITSDHYFLQPTSKTFHGRDVFAPIAAWLSKGVDPAKFGDEITDYARFTMPRPKKISETEFKAVVMKVDKFGNLITNITPERCAAVVRGESTSLQTERWQGRGHFSAWHLRRRRSWSAVCHARQHGIPRGVRQSSLCRPACRRE